MAARPGPGRDRRRDVRPAGRRRRRAGGRARGDARRPLRPAAARARRRRARRGARLEPALPVGGGRHARRAGPLADDVRRRRRARSPTARGGSCRTSPTRRPGIGLRDARPVGDVRVAAEILGPANPARRCRLSLAAGVPGRAAPRARRDARACRARASCCSREASITRRTSSTRRSPGCSASTSSKAPDLVVRQGRLWLRTLGGLDPIDVVYRRVEDADIDPIEVERTPARPGVPGLLIAVGQRRHRARQRARRRRRRGPVARAAVAGRRRRRLTGRRAAAAAARRRERDGATRRDADVPQRRARLGVGRRRASTRSPVPTAVTVMPGGQRSGARARRRSASPDRPSGQGRVGHRHDADAAVASSPRCRRSTSPRRCRRVPPTRCSGRDVPPSGPRRSPGRSGSSRPAAVRTRRW